jgi:hypothetical protein
MVKPGRLIQQIRKLWLQRFFAADGVNIELRHSNSTLLAMQGGGGMVIAGFKLSACCIVLAATVAGCASHRKVAKEIRTSR